MDKDMDVGDAVNFCLIGYSQIQTERLFVILTIGLLNSLELGLINVDEFHAALFNPRTLNQLKEFKVNSDIIDLCHRSLFLEDIEQLYSSKMLAKNISELKVLASQILSKSKYDSKAKNQWFVKHSF